MSTALVIGGDTKLLVDSRERRMAGELVEAMAGQPERLVLDEQGQRPTELDPQLTQIIAHVIEVMARGGSVTIGSIPEELTTTVAAELLGISRPTLVKLIRAGEIPAHTKGSHHRLRRDDVIAFRKARLERQRRAFDELREMEDSL